MDCSQLVDNVFTHNLEYIGAMTWSDRLPVLLRIVDQTRPGRNAGLDFLRGGLDRLGHCSKRQWLAFLAGWLIASMIGVSASGYFFPHYFQQLLAAAALTAAVGGEMAERTSALEEIRAFQRDLFSLLLVILPLKTLWPFGSTTLRAANFGISAKNIPDRFFLPRRRECS